MQGRLPLVASVEPLPWRGTGLSQDQLELRGPDAFELHRLDRILGELARPSLDARAIDPETRERLAGVGIVIGGAPCRSSLIERVWGRKRELMHSLSGPDHLGPPPCA
jgi:hypothetical protein